MPKTIRESPTGFALQVSIPGRVSGFITGEEGRVRVFASRKEAERFLKQLTQSGKYSWRDCQTEVVPYDK